MATRLIPVVLAAVCSNYPLPPPSEDGTVPDPACQLRNPKLMEGLTLDIVTLLSPPLSSITEKNVTRGIGKFAYNETVTTGSGIVFDFVDILIRVFGFDYRVSVPPGNELGGNTSGIIGELVQKKADMAAAMLPFIPSFGSVIRYSVGLMESDWVVLMKRPASSASGSGLLAPFDDTVWFLILAALIAVGPVIYILLLVRWWLARDEQAEASMFPIGQCVWFVFGALMKQGSTLSPITDSSRIVFATWWIFITILTSFYTANLTAFLTLSKFTLPIKDAKDIAKYNYKWVAQTGGPLHHLVSRNDEFQYLRDSISRQYGLFMNKTDKEMLEEIANNNRMYLREKNAVEHLMLQDYNLKAKDYKMDEKDRCKYVMTPDAFMVQTIAFAYKDDSDLHKHFDRVLLNLVETGIVKYLMRRDLPQVQVCPLDLGSKERQLRNSDLWMTYMVVITGFSTSIAVFIGEMLIRMYRYCNARELEKHQAFANQYPGDWKNMALKKSQLLPYGAKPGALPTDFGMINAKNGQQKLMSNMRGSESAFMFQYTA